MPPLGLKEAIVLNRKLSYDRLDYRKEALTCIKFVTALPKFLDFDLGEQLVNAASVVLLESETTF